MLYLPLTLYWLNLISSRGPFPFNLCFDACVLARVPVGICIALLYSTEWIGQRLSIHSTEEGQLGFFLPYLPLRKALLRHSQLPGTSWQMCLWGESMATIAASWDMGMCVSSPGPAGVPNRARLGFVARIPSPVGLTVQPGRQRQPSRKRVHTG